jgi:ABC-type glycerol-3-phosphate transport system substrate-binding protein
LILALTLSACESLAERIPWLRDTTPTPTSSTGEMNEITPTPGITPTTQATPEPVTELTLWVPPEMDPELDTQASQLLADQLQYFSDLHDGLEINVRVKAPSGVGGLLDALTATSAAAPDALPDLIALSRPDLETAALKGLIHPLDGMTEIPDDADWFDFTRDMALLQGSTFGLPFAGDSLVLVYRSASFASFPDTWGEVFNGDVLLAFAAESDQALFQLALYQSQGGAIVDNQRRPMFESEPLTDVFQLLQTGVEQGTLPDWLNQYQTPDQVWTAFREGQVNLGVTWLSNYLREMPADTAFSSLLPMSVDAVTYGTGMSWTVATSDENRQALAVELAEFLVQPDFLAEWSQAIGVIPVRPSALEGWENQSLTTSINQVAKMTLLRPSNDLLSSLGPVLREGTRQMLQGLSNPAQAVQAALESLEE